MSGGAQIHVRVTEVHTVAHNVKRFRLAAASGDSLPLFSAGSHVVVTMHDGIRTYHNPYSLMGPLEDNSTYQISVLKTTSSRGGSRFMHEQVARGSTLTISHPINLFPIDRRGRKHLLIAGGIGVTPLMAMAQQLHQQDKLFELHYSIRNVARGAYATDLTAQYGRRVHVYHTGEGHRPSWGRLLEYQPLGTHLYVCGPQPMIDAVLDTAQMMGWPDDNVHSERFLAPASGEPFVVRLVKSGISVTVREHESILDAVEAAGVDAPYLCRGGACGQCETSIVSNTGELVHNDHYLTAEEHAIGRKIMICVSRLKGCELAIDL